MAFWIRSFSELVPWGWYHLLVPSSCPRCQHSSPVRAWNKMVHAECHPVTLKGWDHWEGGNVMNHTNGDYGAQFGSVSCQRLSWFHLLIHTKRIHDSKKPMFTAAKRQDTTSLYVRLCQTDLTNRFIKTRRIWKQVLFDGAMQNKATKKVTYCFSCFLLLQWPETERKDNSPHRWGCRWHMHIHINC